MTRNAGLTIKKKTMQRGLRIKMARTRLGDLLVARGRITERDLDRALEKQRVCGKKLGDILLNEHQISRVDLFGALGQQITTRFVLMAVGICLTVGGASVGLARAAQTIYSYPPTQVAFNAAPPRAAIDSRPAGLFGRNEVLSTNIKAFTKWTGVLARMNDRANSPKALEVAYAPYGLGSLDTLSRAPVQDRITHINNVVNKLRYVEDRDSYGKSDYWATPKESATRGVADCEDYAIAKYALLKAVGVPEHLMRIAIVKDMQKNIPHAVLIVYNDNGHQEVLDNQSQFVKEATAISWYAPLYSINSQAWWRHI